MPPQLALLLCSVFVLYLLRIERKQSPDVSPALWLPTLWMLSVSTKPLASWFSIYGGDGDGSPLDQRFVIVVMCAGAVVLARRKFDWAGARRSQPWLMLFVGYMFLSLMWSDLPFTCFKRLFRQTASLIMAFVLLSEPKPRQALETILRRTVYILIPVSVLLIKYYPHLGVEYGRWTGGRMWVGVSTQKNGLARLCIIAVLFLVWVLLQKWRIRPPPAMRQRVLADVLILLIALVLLLNPAGKSSATSIVAVCAGIGTLLGLFWLQHSQRKVQFSIVAVSVVTLVGLGMAFPFVGGSFAVGFSEALGRNSTFTGRADIWAAIVPSALGHPILGCGFGSYWTAITHELHHVNHAHSAYLDLFNELGVVGLLLFTFYILSVARNAHNALSLDYEWGSLCISFLVMLLVHGFTESNVNTLMSQFGATLLFLAMSLSTVELSVTNGAPDSAVF